MAMTFSKVTEFYPTSEETTAAIRDFRNKASQQYEEQHSEAPGFV